MPLKAKEKEETSGRLRVCYQNSIHACFDFFPPRFGDLLSYAGRAYSLKELKSVKSPLNTNKVSKVLFQNELISVGHGEKSWESDSA